MDHQQIDHWPYLIYRDGATLCINDREEYITFVRETIGPNNYSLGVIGNFGSHLLTENPYAFLIFDEMTLNEWRSYNREYVRHKREGKQALETWLDNVFAHLFDALYNDNDG
jgi:hypothetical protein